MQFRLIQYHLEKLALNLYIINVLFHNAHDLEKSLKLVHIKSKLIVAGISCNINN